jgi:hypothetical protein
MTEKLPWLKAADVIRILQKRGFILVLSAAVIKNGVILTLASR